MDQQDRIMDGDLQTLGLQAILKMLALSEKTGKLFVSSGPETLSISLRKGQIVGLHEDGMPQPDILGMLCLINKLDPPRAQKIRELAHGDGQLALAMLVERGWMSANEMQRRLEFAVTQSISHALCWVNGRFAFHRQLVPIESRLNPLDVDSVLLEALRQADEWEEVAGEGVSHLTRTTVARWLPEVSNDVRSLGLNQESIDVLCLSNGELTLQAVALVLMVPEARVARVMAQLLQLNLIEVVDTVLETELQQDLSNIIIKCQHTLAQQKNAASVEQHLLGLVTTLAECINALLVHHGTYARSLRGRGHVPSMEVVRYLERRFLQQLRMIGQHQYSILETTTFTYGQLDCSDILTLNKLVKGVQLEEFYWEAVQGLATFLRIIFTELLRDEVGNSHIGRQLNVAWKIFLSEIDHDIQQYQVFRAQRRAHQGRGREMQSVPSLGVVQNWNGNAESQGECWSPETRRRSI
jgi:predicted DNA-binding ribbon-helix-helix protein